jgi:hypothetical protein
MIGLCLGDTDDTTGEARVNVYRLPARCWVNADDRVDALDPVLMMSELHLVKDIRKVHIRFAAYCQARSARAVRLLEA